MQGPQTPKPRHFCNLDMAIVHLFTCVSLESMCFVTEKSGLCFILKAMYFKIEILYILTTSKCKLNLHEYVVYYND